MSVTGGSRRNELASYAEMVLIVLMVLVRQHGDVFTWNSMCSDLLIGQRDV